MTRGARAVWALFTGVYPCGLASASEPGGPPSVSMSAAVSVEASPDVSGLSTARVWGALQSSRRRAAPVRLADGRVLVVGGVSATGVLASCAVYTPSTGRWSRVAELRDARAEAEAVLLPDGRVLVAGGLDAQRLPVRSAELYDPVADRWTRTGAPLSARAGSGVAVVLDSGEVLFVGGLMAELYDPVQGTWRRAGPVGGAAGTHRAGHSVTRLVDGRVLVVGGMTARAAATAELYDPASGEWRRVAPPGTPREGHGAMVTFQGRVLVAGGFHARTGALASVESYDPVADTWREEPALVSARREVVLLPLEDGAAWVAGGEAGGERYEPRLCLPLTCLSARPSCGAPPDGCGGALACGACVEASRSGPEGCGVERAVYDGLWGAPRCSGADAGCGSGEWLVGRGGVGPEPHAPNTLGHACADGEGGLHARDESLDGLRVFTEDGEPLAPGKRVRVEASVWASTRPGTNRLDLYAAADARAPEWTYLTTLTPGRVGAQVLTATYVLPAGAWQALRGVFRYAGSVEPCPGGVFDDVDDLVFATR